MGLFPQKICLLANLIRIEKRNNFIEECFSIRALFRRANFENSKITVVTFLGGKKGTYS
jgi:hypothetical protein